MPEAGIEVELIKPFSVIRETLERIGIANKKEKKIFPSCYAKKEENSRVKIYHFKELLKTPTMSDEDVKRRNTIVWLLSKWNLIKIKDSMKDAVVGNMLEKKIFILPKQQKIDEKWEVYHKYHFEGRNINKGNKIEGGV